MAKIIAYDDEARQGMLAGLDKLADTVKVTLGRRGIRTTANTCTHTRKNVITPAEGKNSISAIVMMTQTATSRYWR